MLLFVCDLFLSWDYEGLFKILSDVVMLWLVCEIFVLCGIDGNNEYGGGCENGGWELRYCCDCRLWCWCLFWVWFDLCGYLG